MYAKIFTTLYSGTLRGRPHEILVFTNLLAHCDKDGYVDQHFRAIAEEVGLTQDQVRAATLNLEAPDPESRSPEEAGARIIRQHDHRAWGWLVVNYVRYRDIRDAEDRREQNRRSQATYRAKHKPSKQIADSNQSNQGNPESAKVEVAVAVAVKGEGTPPSPDSPKPSNRPQERPTQSQIISLEKELERLTTHLKSLPQPQDQSFSVSNGKFIDSGKEPRLAHKALLSRKAELEATLSSLNQQAFPAPAPPPRAQ